MYLFFLLLPMLSVSYNESTLETEYCKDRGECFSGAWFTHVSHLMEAPMMAFYFKNYGRMFIRGKGNRKLPCEEASYFLFHKTQKKKTNTTYNKWGDFPAQTIDLLDFSVLHLSVAERLLSRSPPLRHLVTEEITDITTKLASVYNQKNIRSLRKSNGLRSITALTREKLDGTLVVIPVILNTQGKGNSGIKFRRRYLELTIDSVAPYFKHIVVAVAHQDDYAEMLSSKLPIWQVIKLDLANDCGLPVASVIESTRRILNEDNWKRFKYVYFTEADQILLWRGIDRVFYWADQNAKAVLTPHRLVVTPAAYLKTQNKSEVFFSIISRQKKNFTSPLPNDNV